MNYSRVFLAVFAFVASACQVPAKTPLVVFDSSKLGTIERNIRYCTMQNVPLKMDIYYPKTGKKPFPVVVYIHGGGWVEGTKDSVPEYVDVNALQELGFLTASIEYRLAPQYKFPAMIEDARCAVRFLRAHALEYNIDPARFGAIGDSAGGHIVSLLGLVDDESEFDTGEFLNVSSRVQAVVDLYGPTNLEEKFARKLFFDPMEVFGTRDGTDPIFTEASPVHHVTPDDAAFLIIHGNKDTTVPPLQSRMLLKALQEAGIPSELVIVTKAEHNLLETGLGPIDPSLDDLKVKIQQFWQKYLMGD